MKKLIFFFFMLTLIFIISINAQTDSGLSDKDIKYIELFKRHGLLPENIDKDNSSTKKLKIYLEYLKQAYPIDDIRTFKENDYRFSSPEKTWELYRTSYLAGDIELANKCLMPKYREKHNSIRKAIGNDNMKQRIEEMRSIEKIIEEDGRAKYAIKRKIEGQDITFFIYFVNVFGNWKILRY